MRSKILRTNSCVTIVRTQIDKDIQDVQKKVTNRILLESQCTGRHPLCLEIVYFVLKTTQDHLLWSQVYRKIRPTKYQFWLGFFYYLLYFGTPCITLRNGQTKTQRPLLVLQSNHHVIVMVVDIITRKKGFYWYMILFSDMLYIRRTIKTVIFTTSCTQAEIQFC